MEEEGRGTRGDKRRQEEGDERTNTQCVRTGIKHTRTGYEHTTPYEHPSLPPHPLYRRGRVGKRRGGGEKRGEGRGGEGRGGRRRGGWVVIPVLMLRCACACNQEIEVATKLTRIRY